MDGLIAYALSKKYADEVGQSILDAGFKTQVEQDRSILQTVGQEKILYFIPKTIASPSDGYDEYVYSNNTWEPVGATDVDLSSYALKNEIPTKVSQLQNDSGYLTEHQDISDKANKATTLSGYGITDAYTKSEVDAAVGGTDDYTQLTNKPQINGVTLDGDKSPEDLLLQKKIYFTAPPAFPSEDYQTGDLFYYNKKLYRQMGTGWNNVTETYVTYNKVGRFIHYGRGNPPTSVDSVSVPDYDPGDLHVKRSSSMAANSLGDMYGAEIYLCADVLFNSVSGSPQKMRYTYTWIKLPIGATTLSGYGITDAYTKSEVDAAVGSKTISSAAVNNNGTITFTLSDGSAITTTGTSVFGPQGPAGTNGQDYNLTAQDKSDIAALVMAQLPTTQGVLYGNASN